MSDWAGVGAGRKEATASFSLVNSLRSTVSLNRKPSPTQRQLWVAAWGRENRRGRRKPLLWTTEASQGTEAGEREEVWIAGPGEGKRAARCSALHNAGVTLNQVPQ